MKIILVIAMVISISLNNVEFIYAQTLLVPVDEVNKANEKAGAKWTAGENQFSGKTIEELKKYLTGVEEFKNLPTRASGSAEGAMTNGQDYWTNPKTYPGELDYRNYNGKSWLSPVQSQDICGSCVIFSALGALEAGLKIKYQAPDWDLNLSEQFWLSCGNSGAGRSCQGNSIAYTSDLVTDGAIKEKWAPYQVTSSISCAQAANVDPSTVGRYKIGEAYQQLAHIYFGNGYTTVNASTIAQIKYILNAHGPFMATMTVYGDFARYESGVYSHTIDGQIGQHAVLVIGYSDADQCVIIKNSWGWWWGEKGFARISYNELTAPDGYFRQEFSPTLFGYSNMVFDNPHIVKAEADDPALPNPKIVNVQLPLTLLLNTYLSVSAQ